MVRAAWEMLRRGGGREGAMSLAAFGDRCGVQVQVGGSPQFPLPRSQRKRATCLLTCRREV